MMISLSASGIIVPPLKYGFPRHRSTVSLLVALIGKKPGCFAWCMNIEFIVKGNIAIFPLQLFLL
jgi:hypothetical protein